MRKKKHCYWRRETILRHLEEYHQTPEGANDHEAEMLIAAIKKRLAEKAEQQARSEQGSPGRLALRGRCRKITA